MYYSAACTEVECVEVVPGSYTDTVIGQMASLMVVNR